MMIAILWIAWHFRLNLIMVFHTLRTSFTFLYLPSFQVLLLFQTKEEEGRTREMTGSGAVLTRERGHCGASAGISVAVQWEHPQSSGTTTHRGAPHQPPQALSTPVLPHHHRKHCISQLLEKRKKEKKIDYPPVSLWKPVLVLALFFVTWHFVVTPLFFCFYYFL